MDQPRIIRRVRHAGMPATGAAIAEPRAQCEDDIGAARGAVRRIDAIAPDRAERPLAIVRKRSLALRGCRNRDLEQVRQMHQLLAGPADQASMAGQDHRALRLQQQIEGGFDNSGGGAVR